MSRGLRSHHAVVFRNGVDFDEVGAMGFGDLRRQVWEMEEAVLEGGGGLNVICKTFSSS